MAEYIIDTTEAEQKYVVSAADYLAKFTHVMGSPLKEEVVRCRDCKHRGTVRLVDVGFHETRVIDCEAVEPNGFCKWGERKSE